jgi:hypothetical protein
MCKPRPPGPKVWWASLSAAGLSGAKFAARAGTKYQAFAARALRREAARAVDDAAEGGGGIVEVRAVSLTLAEFGAVWKWFRYPPPYAGAKAGEERRHAAVVSLHRPRRRVLDEREWCP